jgi:hypothetical protein
MTAAGAPDRNGNAAEYLQLLRLLAGEMERAMRAIAHNALPDLEESVASQQIMSARLLVLAAELSAPLESSSIESGPAASPAKIDDDLAQQVRVAGDALHTLNRRYAALLQHSSRSVALMASLFNSFQGKFKEASGPRLKHQTWSCQM